MKIEEYHFGFVVCEDNGVALSQSFKTLEEAKECMRMFQDAEDSRKAKAKQKGKS